MIAYFSNAKFHKPVAVTKAPFKNRKDVGLVLQPFDRPSMVLLKNHKGGFFRLSWNEPGAKKSKTGSKIKGDPRRSVPSGAYQVATYRIHAVDDKGAPWFLSVTRPHLKKFGVHRDHTAKIKLNAGIHLKLHAKRDGGTLRVGVGVMDAQHGGMSIYHKGKRISLGYRIEDAQGKTLVRGALKYG